MTPTCVRAVTFWTIVVCTGALTRADGAKGDLLTALRSNDTRTVRSLLKAGADPNARDDIGTTALMHAAAFASLDAVKALLDAGADANASSAAGATALMWAAGDVAKIRLLLDRGAIVTRRTKDGTTALVAAARRGNVEAMQVLLAHGADPKADAGEKVELLRIAYSDHPETRTALAGVGIDLKSLASAVAPSLASFSLANTEALDALLTTGATPNPRGRFPIVASAAFQGYRSSVALLLERGANVNAKGQRDVTPLMMAAGAPNPDPMLVRLLIDKGADLNARDQSGHSALDWALLQGQGPVSQLLREAGASATPMPPAPIPRPQPRSTRAALESALVRLQPISPVLYDNRKCIACHHQTLPLMAMAIAGARAIPIERERMAHPIRSIVDVWNGRREDLMIGREVAGGANELAYGLVALAEARVPPNSATDAAIANLLALQRGDGSWVFLDTRPPQADNSPISFTAMAIRGLDVYTPPALRDEIKMRVTRAQRYLRTASATSTQDEAFKLLGLVWSRAPRAEIASQRARVAALQRPDGGWAQLSTMDSDAYASGEALYALGVSGLAATDAAYQRGLKYLLRTQLDDGSWFVRSRAFGFQPYFESGFPHGRDQFISASATAWAAMALAGAL
jgi:ankyrin repeat protein